MLFSDMPVLFLQCLGDYERKRKSMFGWAGGLGKTWFVDEEKYEEQRKADPHRVVFPEW